MVDISVSAYCDAIKYIQHGNKYYPGQIVSYENKKYILDKFEGNVTRACPLWEVLEVRSSDKLYSDDLEEYPYVNGVFKFMYRAKSKHDYCIEHKHCSKCDKQYGKYNGFEYCPYCGNKLKTIVDEGCASIDDDVIKE